MFTFTATRHCVCGQSFTVPTSLGMSGPRRCLDCREKSGDNRQMNRSRLVDEIITDLKEEAPGPEPDPESLESLEALVDPAEEGTPPRPRRGVIARRTAISKRMGTIALGERDGWRCALCGEPVDPGVEWPHRRSPSIDHVVPLSRGGADANQNIQLAHLGCNSAKGNRSEE